MCGCYNKQRVLTNRPTAQPDTTWVSTDGRVKFTVEEKYTSQDEWYIHSSGEIYTDDGVDYVVVIFGPWSEIHVVPIEDSDDNFVNLTNVLEYWVGDFQHPDRFTAKIKETTHFNVGENIEFYRIDE